MKKTRHKFLPPWPQFCYTVQQEIDNSRAVKAYIWRKAGRTKYKIVKSEKFTLQEVDYVPYKESVPEFVGRIHAWAITAVEAQYEAASARATTRAEIKKHLQNHKLAIVAQVQEL